MEIGNGDGEAAADDGELGAETGGGPLQGIVDVYRGRAVGENGFGEFAAYVIISAAVRGLRGFLSAFSPLRGEKVIEVRQRFPGAVFFGAVFAQPDPTGFTGEAGRFVDAESALQGVVVRQVRAVGEHIEADFDEFAALKLTEH